MYFLKRSMSFVRFRVVGQFAFSPDEFQKALTKNAFRDLSEMSIEVEEFCGWVSPENCLQPPEIGAIMLDPYFKLTMRIDRRKIPNALMAAHLAIEERAAWEGSGKKKLSRSRRAELKRSVREFLLERAPVTSSLYRALWNYRTATCYVFASSSGVQRALAKLFLATFSLDLAPLTPWAIAESWAVQHNLSQGLVTEPSSFRSVGD